MADNDQTQAQKDSYLHEWKAMLMQSTTFQQRTMLSSAASKPAQEADALQRTPWAISKVDQLELDYEEFSVPGGSIASRQLRSRTAQKPSDLHQGSEVERTHHVQDQGPSTEQPLQRLQSNTAAPPAAPPVSGVPERLANLPDPSFDDEDKMAKRRRAKIAGWMLPWRCPGACAYLVVLVLLFVIEESTLHIVGTTNYYPQKVLTALSAATATFQSVLQDASPPPLVLTSSPTPEIDSNEDNAVSSGDEGNQVADVPDAAASAKEEAPSSLGEDSTPDPPANTEYRQGFEPTDDRNAQQGSGEGVPSGGNNEQEGDGHNDDKTIGSGQEFEAAVEAQEADRDKQVGGESGGSSEGGDIDHLGKGNSEVTANRVEEKDRQDEKKDESNESYIYSPAVPSPLLPPKLPPSPSSPAISRYPPSFVVKHMGTTTVRGGDSNMPVVIGKGGSEFQEEVVERRPESDGEGVRDRRLPSPWAHDEADGFVKFRSHRRRRVKRIRETGELGEGEDDEQEEEEEVASKMAGKRFVPPVTKQWDRGEKEGGWRSKNPETSKVAAEENADEIPKERRTRSKPKPLTDVRPQPVRHNRETLPGAMTNFHWERALPEPARSKRRRSPSVDDVEDSGLGTDLKGRRTSKPATTSIEEVSSAGSVRRSGARLRGTQID